MSQVGIAGNMFETYGSSGYFNAFALGAAARPLKTNCFFNDFVGDVTPPRVSPDLYAWYGGAGAAVGVAAGLADRPGLILGQTGTTAAGYAAIAGNELGCLLGGGEYTVETDFYLSALTGGGENYVFQFGICDTVNADQVDGAYFTYDATVDNVWLYQTANNSARSLVTSAVGVAAGAWIRLKVVVNAAGTLASYYINNALVGTLAANIPTGAGRNLTPLMTMYKTLGAASRYYVVDWVWYHYDLTVSR
jgi:hypothetical protein